MSVWFISPLREPLTDQQVREAWQPWLRLEKKAASP